MVFQLMAHKLSKVAVGFLMLSCISKIPWVNWKADVGYGSEIQGSLILK